jgi:transposase
MSKKRHTAEEIVAKLRQVDVLTAQGRSVAEAIRSIGVTEVTYYRWRSEYGGPTSDQVKRLKECLDARPPWRQRRPGGLGAKRQDRAASSAGWRVWARRPGAVARPDRVKHP